MRDFVAEHVPEDWWCVLFTSTKWSPFLNDSLIACYRSSAAFVHPESNRGSNLWWNLLHAWAMSALCWVPSTMLVTGIFP